MVQRESEAVAQMAPMAKTPVFWGPVYGSVHGLARKEAVSDLESLLSGGMLCAALMRVVGLGYGGRG